MRATENRDDTVYTRFFRSAPSYEKVMIHCEQVFLQSFYI